MSDHPTSDSMENQLQSVRRKKHDAFIRTKSNADSSSSSDLSQNDELAAPPVVTFSRLDSDLPEVAALHVDSSRRVHLWPEDTVLVAGDSLLGGVKEHKLSARRKIKVRPFSGATVLDMYDYLKPLVLKKPKRVILQIGANDCPYKNSEEIVDEMIELKAWIKSISPDSTVVFCEMPVRTDDRNADAVRASVNAMLDSISDLPCIRNSNISMRNLSVTGRFKGLHLNLSGTKQLAINILSFLKSDF